MNVGLILTPVSIYSMSKGVLVLWVGVLSVIFLGRRLWLYQWASLVTVTLGVCLVGLSGSLVKKELNDLPSDQANVINAFANIARRGDDDPAKVALGVILILFAQVFTASQFVSRHGLVKFSYPFIPLTFLNPYSRAQQPFDPMRLNATEHC